jgi:hypothetical protein
MVSSMVVRQACGSIGRRLRITGQSSVHIIVVNILTRLSNLKAVMLLSFEGILVVGSARITVQVDSVNYYQLCIVGRASVCEYSVPYPLSFLLDPELMLKAWRKGYND